MTGNSPAWLPPAADVRLLWIGVLGMGFAGALHVLGTLPDIFADAAFSPERWIALAIRALPQLRPAVVRRRWAYAVSLLLAVVEGPVDRAALVDFLVGGISA